MLRVLGLVVGLGLLGWPIDGALAARPQAATCQGLIRAAVPDPTTKITSAEPIAAAPEHCEVFGKLQARVGANGQPYAVKFHLRLPSEWNGRFYFQGGGGTNGFVGDALGRLPGQAGTALASGYAVISQDSGHDNATNNDPKLQGVATFGWDAEARRNYGGAAIGPVVRTGKALIKAYYGRKPKLTYFVGGSKGGQEAMMAVQRFPEDFEGAIIGYPGFRLAYAGGVGQIWDGQAFAEAARAMGKIGADGLPLVNKAMSDEDLVLTSDAILTACDGLDATIDGMVENFTACTTDRVSPALEAITCHGDKAPNCLLAVQVKALKTVFNGARAADGRLLYADWPWDPGVGVRTARGVSQGWRQWKLGAYEPDVNNGLLMQLAAPAVSAVFTSPPTPVANELGALTRYLLSASPEDNYRKAQVKWGRFNESAVDFMNADSVDLRRFAARGGKILIYHGVADPVFSINDTLAWLKRVDAYEHGRANRFIAFYAIPGLNHGGGGPATDRFDLVSALVAWRERGVAPGPIIAAAGPDTPWPGRTRLLCPFPRQPRRDGPDIEAAGSFRCVSP